MKGKQEMNWLFNQEEARAALPIIGARNLTEVIALVIVGGIENRLYSYDKMVQYKTEFADKETLLWMEKMISHIKSNGTEEYVYFRFKRWN